MNRKRDDISLNKKEKFMRRTENPETVLLLNDDYVINGMRVEHDSKGYNFYCSKCNFQRMQMKETLAFCPKCFKPIATIKDFNLYFNGFTEEELVKVRDALRNSVSRDADTMQFFLRRRRNDGRVCY